MRQLLKWFPNDGQLARIRKTRYHRHRTAPALPLLFDSKHEQGLESIELGLDSRCTLIDTNT